MKKLVCTVLIMTGLTVGNALAQEELAQDELGRLNQENAELRQRIEKLEAALSEIKARMGERPRPVSEEQKPAVVSTYPIALYGRLKFDAAYDTARTDVGNFARWVESEENREDDDQFNATARESRLGLIIHGPDVAGLLTSGRVEVDFYEGGAENKTRLMMRHAYLQLDWPEYDFSILAGQTSDVISPLCPYTLNYSVAWWVGNIGYRRPQFRLTKGFDLGEANSVLLQGAASRTIGDDIPYDPGDTGEDAGFPTLQGRAALSFPFLTNERATVGISGHWGEEEFDLDNADSNEDLDSWSINLDFTFPIRYWLTLKGELWTGENLDSYLGGIGQGINQVKREEIASVGGWAALSFGPFGRCH
ncbi:MAG: hypothetical protein JSV16_14145 [Candidatus Hydrogenedentota bacterium]|nr:MAG: hypothetical protein JSV16_14145 [Candidatus Hydrogenedentota bacterium]